MSFDLFAQARRALRKPRPYRIDLEALEDRLVLAANFHSAPVIPEIDAGMKAQLQSVYRLGQALGDRADVFSKVGDSNSWYTTFLDPLGMSNYDSNMWSNLGSYTSLQNTVAYFKNRVVDSEYNNSFNHSSIATFGGWTSTNLLTPSERGSATGLPAEAFLPPLQAEIQETRPAIALVMIGTCEVGFDDTQTYEKNLTTITQYLLSQGVIPVLSTIPEIKLSPDPNLVVQVELYNQIIADVAGTNDVPLWNLSAALTTLPNQGLSTDQVHLSVGPDGSGDFASADLSFGMNVRNLTAVQVLNKLLTVVEQNGPADATTSPNPGVAAAPFLAALYQSILQRNIDSAGQAAFTQQLNIGYSAGEIVQEIWNSSEHRIIEIVGYYSQLFHRPADFGGLQYWQHEFALGLSETAVQAAFATSPEYLNAHPDNTAFVAGLYEDLLQRGPSVGEADGWAHEVQSDGSGVGVATKIAESQEAYKLVIDQFYQNFLGRPADQGGMQYALVLLQDPFNGFLPLAELLMTSAEYLNRE